MKHRVKKAKFGHGLDANNALFRKMCYNFFSHGKLTTTVARAKAVRSMIDTLVSRMDEPTLNNKSFVYKVVQDKALVEKLFEKVGPVAKVTRGGYVTLQRTHVRANDGAEMAQIAWAHDITLVDAPEAPKKEAKKPAAEKKAAPKAEAKKAEEKKESKVEEKASK